MSDRRSRRLARARSLAPDVPIGVVAFGPVTGKEAFASATKRVVTPAAGHVAATLGTRPLAMKCSTQAWISAQRFDVLGHDTFLRHSVRRRVRTPANPGRHGRSNCRRPPPGPIRPKTSHRRRGRIGCSARGKFVQDRAVSDFPLPASPVIITGPSICGGATDFGAQPINCCTDSDQNSRQFCNSRCLRTLSRSTLEALSCDGVKTRCKRIASATNLHHVCRKQLCGKQLCQVRQTLSAGRSNSLFPDADQQSPPRRLTSPDTLLLEGGAGKLRDRAAVVCAAFSPSRKSLSVNVAKTSVGWCHVRVPAAPDLHAALVLAQADRRDEVHERRRVGVGHVRADRRRIVGRVLLVRRVEDATPASSPRRRNFEVDWNSMLTSASGRCSGLHRAVGARHAVVAHHHVVLDHAEPFRLGILARSRRILLALQRLRAARRRRARRSVRSPRCSRARSGSCARSARRAC